MRQVEFSHDVIWQFWVARQMLGGARLFGDIWEVNPPLWYWAALPVQGVALRTGIDWQVLLLPLLILLGAGSAIAVHRLVDLGKPLFNLLLLLIVFWLNVVVPLSDLGQRDHFMLMFGLPYAALIACRASGKVVPLHLTVMVAIPAAFGFAMKHYFIPIPILLELWLFTKQRRNWSPWRPETLTIASLAVVYGICVVWLTPEFFTVALPMIEVSYADNDAPLSHILFHPWTIYWGLAIIYLVITAFIVRKSTDIVIDNFTTCVILLSIGCGFSYYAQHQGPYYHAIPLTGALTIALFLRIIQIEKFRLLSTALGFALLYLPLSTALAIEDKSQQFVARVDSLFTKLPANEPVFVAASNPLFWPAVERHRLLWPARFASMWMLPAIARGEVSGASTPELDALASTLHAATLEDLRCNAPSIIVFPNATPVAYGINNFSIREFLFRDASLRRFVEENYTLTDEPNFAHVYIRQGFSQTESDSTCRPIH